MNLPLLFNVCLMRGFWRPKEPDMARSPVQMNPCPPLICRLMVRNAEQSRGFVVYPSFPAILRVDSIRCFAQVVYSVIGFIAIDVVYKVFRPFAIAIKPRQTVRRIRLVINAKSHVSVLVQAASNTAALPFPAVNNARKESCKTVIRKYFSEALRRHLCAGRFVFHHLSRVL
jgi:hypothetical protein